VVFRIREKFWSWGNDFAITDQNEVPIYFVDGAAFSWGAKLSFQDTSRRELAFIAQKLMTLMPRYEIHVGGRLFAEVVKEWSWFQQKFTLDVPGPNDYSITGSFWQHEFEFVRSGRPVATVSKEYWSWIDSYGVDVAEGEDAVPILCACIVIDQVLHDDDD
jgi:uncharacterized protein YxjI